MNPSIRNLPLVLACVSAASGEESKTGRPNPSQTLPTIRPVLAPQSLKEPIDLLPHLKRLALGKDLRELPILTPTDLSGFYGNTWWFHNHAGQLDVTLTAEEIKVLGVEEVASLGYLAPEVSLHALEKRTQDIEKGIPPPIDDPLAKFNPALIDKMPGNKDAAFLQDYETISGRLHRNTYGAGLYRLFKAIPPSLWDSLQIQKVNPSSSNPKDTFIVIGIGETPIVELTTRNGPKGSIALIYVHYLIWPSKLRKFAESLSPSSS